MRIPSKDLEKAKIDMDELKKNLTETKEDKELDAIKRRVVFAGVMPSGRFRYFVLTEEGAARVSDKKNIKKEDIASEIQLNQSDHPRVLMCCHEDMNEQLKNPDSMASMQLMDLRTRANNGLLDPVDAVKPITQGK